VATLDGEILYELRNVFAVILRKGVPLVATKIAIARHVFSGLRERRRLARLQSTICNLRTLHTLCSLHSLHIL
jgi:hypothetical protein